MNETEQDILSEVAMVVDSESFLKKWSLSISKKQIWPFPISFSCCSREIKAFQGAHLPSSMIDVPSYYRKPSEADLLVVGGTITHKMAPHLKKIYHEMPANKWVLAVGACASSGGPYWTQSVVQGLSQLFPVDVYLPGCPPSPEAIIQSFELIQDRIERRVSAYSQVQWSLNV